MAAKWRRTTLLGGYYDLRVALQRNGMWSFACCLRSRDRGRVVRDQSLSGVIAAGALAS